MRQVYCVMIESTNIMTTKAKHPVRATEKSLRILDSLQELRGAGVTDLSRYLSMSKATVHHHLSTLEEFGYVVKEGNEYRLGMRLFEMGQFACREREILDLAKRDVESLAQETGELANLMIEEQGRGIYIHIARGENAVQLDTKIGTSQPLHASALGKAILSELSDERRNEIFEERGLPQVTPNTVTDRDELLTEIGTIQERGFAIDGEERAEGIRCVAAPITTNTGRLVGAVSVSGPSTRLKNERLNETIPEFVQNTANVIGINATYSHPV